MENIQNMESKKESLLTFMQGQDASILNDPVLKDWKQQLCASRVNFSLGKLPTADCTYQDIVNYGQQNPLQLEEAAQILDKQWFTQEAVKGETAFEIGHKEFQDKRMLSNARDQLINQNILAICSVPQEISEKPAKDVANGAGASLNTSERGTNNKPGSNPPPPVSDNKAIDAGGPAK